MNRNMAKTKMIISFISIAFVMLMFYLCGKSLGDKDGYQTDHEFYR